MKKFRGFNKNIAIANIAFFKMKVTTPEPSFVTLTKKILPKIWWDTRTCFHPFKVCKITF